MASKRTFPHSCTPETQGLDKMCLACTQQIYFDCLARHRGQDVPLDRSTRFAWADDVSFVVAERRSEEMVREYSAGAAAAVFKEMGVGIHFELQLLRRLTNARVKKNTPAVRLKALELIQTLRREVMAGIRVPATESSTNGTAPKREFPKDTWQGKSI